MYAGFAAFYTVALYHIFRVVSLADGDGPFLTFLGDIHAKASRHVAYARHLEPAHQLLLELAEKSFASSEGHNIVHVESQNDEARPVLVDVHAWIVEWKSMTVHSISVLPNKFFGLCRRP